MADFVAVLKKTIGGLSDNSPEMRAKVYQRARDTVAAKLAAIDPPPSPIVAERQGQALEAAITAVEASYAKPSEIGDEFDEIFAGSPTKTPVADAETSAPEKPETVTPVAAPAMAGAKRESAATTPEPRKRPSMFDAKAGDEELKPVEPTRRPDPVLAGASRVDGDQDAPADRPTIAPPRKRGVSGGLIAAVIALIVIAGAGYGIWVNREDFVALLTPSETVASAPAQEEPATEETVAAEPAVEEAKPETVAAEPPAQPAAEPQPAETQVASVAEEPEKFTQRLTDAGEEVDPGPAGGEPSIGEGTSVAQATQPSGDPVTGTATTATPPSAAAKPTETALPVGQRAIFYEERTTVAESTADTGSTVWSIVQESPGGDLPPEPAIRAEVTIPAKNIQLRMTIRRNADPSLPASHIIEMIFLTAEGFEGGGIDNILRVAFKPSEAAAGSPLIGIPAKIADGYFLVALSSVEPEKEANLQLMRQQSWIDIPIVYSSGRRALVTMERGVPGDRVFIDTLQTWANASSG